MDLTGQLSNLSAALEELLSLPLPALRDAQSSSITDRAPSFGSVLLSLFVTHWFKSYLRKGLAYA